MACWSFYGQATGLEGDMKRRVVLLIALFLLLLLLGILTSLHKNHWALSHVSVVIRRSTGEDDRIVARAAWYPDSTTTAPSLLQDTMVGDKTGIQSQHGTDSLSATEEVSTLATDAYEPCENLPKWVVVTTASSQPTTAMEMFLNRTQGWCLLVVGEESAPEQYSSESNRFIFLTPTEQLSLPFQLVNKTPWTPIHHRNIGYLYAIAHGAKVILDLADHCIPTPVQGQYIPVELEKQVFAKAKVVGDEQDILKKHYWGKPAARSEDELIAWNPYPYFGAPGLQPRGFPKELYRPFYGNNSASTRTCYPIIQQYLINHYPDVDTDAQHPRTTYFDNDKDKIVLPRGVFAPYNAKATVHLYESFWSLLLPMSANSAVSDIWRSYAAQSLFYLLPDACVLFAPPGFYSQQQDPVNQQDIFIEQTVRDLTTRLVADLVYAPLQFNTFEDALKDVYQLMYQTWYLEDYDLGYVSTWINDLKSIGYIFPEIPNKSKLWTSNIQLCIMFNHASRRPIVRLLLSYYLRFFDHIILLYNGEWSEKPNYVPSFVKFFGCDSNYGRWQQRCLKICLSEGTEGVEGYLYVADDMFVNLTQMALLPRSKVWFSHSSIHNYSDTATPKRWIHWRDNYPGYRKLVDNLPQKWKEVLINSTGFPDRIRGHGLADILYVPQRFRMEMIDVMSFIINTTYIHCEASFALAADIVAPTEQVEMRDKGALWGWDRTRFEVYRKVSEREVYVHAMKLSMRPMADLWCELMTQQMKQLG